jgi:hypothetical protein
MTEYTHPLGAIEAAYTTSADVAIQVGNKLFEYNMPEIYRAHADVLGIEIDAMTTRDRQQAFMNHILTE